MEGGAGDKPCQMQEFMQTERENVCKPCQRQPRSQSCWSRSSESPTFLLSGKERMQLSFLMMLMVIIFILRAFSVVGRMASSRAAKIRYESFYVNSMPNKTYKM